MKKAIRLVLAIAFAGVFVFSAWKIVEVLSEYREGAEGYESLEQYVSFAGIAENPEKQEVPDDAADAIEEVEEMPDLSGWPQVDFEQLAEVNPDVVGWILIEDTLINYPVVQGSDNSYYLKHTFEGKSNAAGTIFLDAGCAGDFSGENSVLYGHHMKNKSMFAGLVKYKKQAFYDAHSQAYLLTPTAYYKIQFFSGYVSGTSGSAWTIDFEEGEYGVWLEEIRERSCFDSEYAPTEADRIVTLSTCSYEFTGARFVLHGYISESVKIPSPEKRIGE